MSGTSTTGQILSDILLGPPAPPSPDSLIPIPAPHEESPPESSSSRSGCETRSPGLSTIFSVDDITHWSQSDISKWLISKGHSHGLVHFLVEEEQVDGKGLLLLTESDLSTPPIKLFAPLLGDRKRLFFDILQLQQTCSLIAQETIVERDSINNSCGRMRPVRFSQSFPCSPPIIVSKAMDRFTRKSLDDVSGDEGNIGSNGNHQFHYKPNHNGNGRGRHSNVRRKPRRTVTFTDSADESQLSDDYDVSGGHGSSTEEALINEKKNSPLGSNHHQHHTSEKYDYYKRPVGGGGYATKLKHEVGKAILAMTYVFVVTWVTAVVMVVVHDRVPDMEKYPPLPDLFLDNMPHIPWAFEMCEVTGTVLFCVWMGVLFFHKHRFILIRRFFALSGTVFLLRCFTMLITSLSVPGTHLKCNPRPYGDWVTRLYNAYLIWKGAGLSIKGVRTCGDYMFSGHTVALTMLNFFITEYTTRRLYYIHTFSWLLNVFGIFFILAAHEHYSIDVFIAFYITSRLFLYYHTLANNQSLMQMDSKRTKIWFPLFSFFEAEVNGRVPNHYEWPITQRRLTKWTKILVRTLENKWKELIPNPNEGFFRMKGFFIPRIRIKKKEG